MRSVAAALVGAALLAAGTARADQTRIRMYLLSADGVGAAIGTIRAADSQQGLRLTPLLKGLAPGPHGMDVHENGDCGASEATGKKVPGLAAGGRFAPDKTARQTGAEGGGLLGGLPALIVDPDGIARRPVAAPRIKLAQIKGRSIVIHAGAENDLDQAASAGGDGARVACGVVP